MWNFFATPQGSAKNRAGTKLVASSKGNGIARLIPFVFSSTQTYVLEFGNLYVRFHQNGGQVISGGVPYEVVTPFTAAMLPYLKYAQVGDTMTLCYGGQEPGGTAATAVQELKRIAHTSWTIAPLNFTVIRHQNGVTGPAPNEAAWSAVVTYARGDRVTGNNVGFISLQDNNLNNALPALANPPPTSTAFWMQANDSLHTPKQYFYRTTATIQSNTDGSIFETGPALTMTWRGVLTTDRPLTISIPTADGGWLPAGYTLLFRSVYRADGDQFGSFGWIGDTTGGTFTDTGNATDLSKTPPQSTDPFATPAGDYPSCVAFFEQRRLFGRQALHPQRLQGSRPGQYTNFDVDLFVKDDDAIRFDIASQQLDEIRALVPLRTLLAFTQSGEYAIEGFQGSPLSPSSVDVRRQMGSRGSSWLDPLVIGNTVLHVQDSGNSVRDLVHDWRTDTYNGTYLSLTATHLFEGRTIVDATYQQIPNSIAWFVRDDGVLLGLTYSTESQDPAMVVVAWHKHTTDGFVENVCSVREGAEDALYLLVRRTINGATKRYVERMQTRVISDVRLACFLDCALSVDGRNAGGTTMAFLSDSTYAGGEEGTIIASAAAFVVGAGSTDIGDAMVLDPDGNAYSLTILSVTDATHARARLDKALPAAWQNVASTSWGWARDSFLGLDHLEGKSVNLLGDGDKQGPFVVAGGQIVGISPPVVIAQIGLAYQPLLEMLDVPGDVAKGKQKIVKSVAAEVTSSRGMKAGEDETNLFEWDDERNVDIGAGTVPLFTGRMKVRIQDAASPDGRAVVVQDDPLPLTIVALTREIAVGGDL